MCLCLLFIQRCKQKGIRLNTFTCMGIINTLSQNRPLYYEIIIPCFHHHEHGVLSVYLNQLTVPFDTCNHYIRRIRAVLVLLKKSTAL